MKILQSILVFGRLPNQVGDRAIHGYASLRSSLFSLDLLPKGRSHSYPWRILLVLLISISGNATLFGQGNDSLITSAIPSLSAINKGKDQDIILRWAPEPAGTWLKSVQRGFYIIEKQVFKSIADFHPENFELVIGPLFPWSSDTIEAKFESTQDSSLLIAGHCLYGEWESIDTTRELDIKGMYDRAQELTNRYGIALFTADRYPIAAEAMALRFVDKNAYVDHSVIYRISLFIDSVLVAQTTTIFDGFDKKVYKPVLKSFGEEEEKIILSWDRKIHEKSYTSYWIERSRDSINFERINTLPYIHAEDVQQSLGESDINYIISVNNYDPYYYRIVGLDPFGDESEPSEAIKLMGKDRTPPPAPNDAKAHMPDDRFMHVEWMQDTTSDDLHAYFILYSKESDGVFLPLSDTLPAFVRSFIDRAPDYINKKFYKICAIDTAGNYACTDPVYGFVQDTFPPEKPTGLHGVIDSSGVVTLQWDLGPERDIDGYHIYFSNRFNGVFSIISNDLVRDTTFQDSISLNSLTKEVFYRIVAVDVRGNYSDFSDMVRVIRPDTIPPGPAIFTKYEVREQGIYMEWHPSRSSDVIIHHLYRSMDGEAFILIDSFINRNENQYLDTIVSPDVRYTYRILAVDDSGLQSTSVQDVSVKSPVKKLVSAPILSVMAEGKKAIISLTYDPSMKKVIIYRSIDKGPFLTWKHLDNQQESLIDDLSPGVEYHYKAMAILESGVKTNFSETQIIQAK
jgi:uncharacterized protein